MGFELILPDIGEGVVEAEVQRWFVKPGDDVLEDQPLVEVMTDKATVTIPSPRRGRVLRLHYREGEVAKVHTPLLELDLDGASAGTAVPTSGTAAATSGAGASRAAADGVGSPPPAAAAADSRQPAQATSERDRRRSLATPAVRAMARQLGVDVNQVRGTGPDGRVTKDDLQRFGVEVRGPQRPTAATPPQRPAPFVDDMPEQPDREPIQHGDEVIPLRGIRRRIAERMAQSKRSAAHFTFVEQVDVTELVKVKDRIAQAAREQGVKVTFLPFVVKAVVAALKKHPWLNATLDEGRGEIRLRREYHIGVASATEQGLVVPVVRHADRLSLLGVAREIERLAADTKAGTASAADLKGSTFTITSLGAVGGLFATPIINLPEVAILGLHRIRPTPVVRDGQIVARDVMHVSLSFDHRVVDGHVGAAFAYEVIRYLEDPSLLFMELA